MLLGVDPDFAESESCIISEVSVLFLKEKCHKMTKAKLLRSCLQSVQMNNLEASLT